MRRQERKVVGLLKDSGRGAAERAEARRNRIAPGLVNYAAMMTGY